MEKINKKEIVTNVFIAIAVIAIIGGFLIGIFKKDKIAPEEEPAELIDYTKENEEVDNAEIKKEEKEIESELRDNPHGEGYGDLGELEEGEVDKSQLPLSYEELLGEKVAKETKKVADKFIKTFYDLEGRNPKHSAERSKDFLTNDLYNELLENPEVPNHYQFNREYITSEISESRNLESGDYREAIPYIIHVEGEFEDVEGKNKEEVSDVFTVFLIEDEDGKYKINEVYKNTYFQ